MALNVRWRVYMYGLPAMGWAVFLMVTALAPSLGPIEDIDIVSHQDKLVHFFQYLVLAFLTFIALSRGTRRDKEWALRVTFVSVVAYGALLEVLQSLVPERDPSLLDLVFNVLGALVGSMVAMVLLARPAEEKARQA